MKLPLKKLPLIGIVLAPFIYLAIIWNTLPGKYPRIGITKEKLINGDKYSLIALLFYCLF
jgi:hypothetical protein